jgi:hypothetical protein
MSEKFTGNREQITLFILGQQDADKLWDICEHKEQRKLTQNAYFHRLVGLLAKGEKGKFYAKKNELIMNYGNHELIRDKDGKLKYVLLPDNDDYKSDALYHYHPTQYVDEFRGMKMRAFVMFQGTHEYDTKAMAHLIECTRNECIGSDIPMSEIETPEERAMFAELKKKAAQDEQKK